jgi:TPR repeat protein
MLVNNPGGQTGSPEARYRLGLMLIEGRGVPQDVRRGRQLIERAAWAGHAPAREWLSANSSN